MSFSTVKYEIEVALSVPGDHQANATVHQATVRTQV